MTDTALMVRKSVPERVADNILTQIQSGALPPGALLPSERVLAETNEISRGSLRAALKRLADEGYLIAEGQVGWRVAAEAKTAHPLGTTLLITNPEKLTIPLRNEALRRTASSKGCLDEWPVSFEDMTQAGRTVAWPDFSPYGSFLVYCNSRVREEFLAPLIATGKPVCCIHHPHQRSCDGIATDRITLVRKAVNLLADRGHRRVLYLSSEKLETMDSIFSASRAAFGAECRARGIARHMIMNDYNAWFRPEDRRRFMDAWKEWTDAGEMPTAVYAEIGWTTLPYITGYLYEMGLCVPDDVSLVAADVRPLEADVEGFGRKAFTGFNDDLEKLVGLAFLKLDSRARHPDAVPSLTLVPPMLVEGETIIQR